MLKFYYESGNDDVAVSNINISKKVKEVIRLYKRFPREHDCVTISQVDMINAVGRSMFDDEFGETIKHDQVCIIVEALDKTFYFDEEGILTESWYEVVPSFDY